MKKIFILLASTFLLTGCIESIVAIGGGASNGKVLQSSLQSAVSYGVKKSTGKTPLGHALNYVKINNTDALKEVYENDGQYVYYEFNDEKYALRTKGFIKEEVKDGLFWREFFTQKKGLSGVGGWKSMT